MQKKPKTKQVKCPHGCPWTHQPEHWHYRKPQVNPSIKGEPWEEEFRKTFAEYVAHERLMHPAYIEWSVDFIKGILASQRHDLLKRMKAKRGKKYWTEKEEKSGTLNPVGSMAQGYVYGYNQALSDLKKIIEE